jgi:hypothetical protein
MGTNLGLLRHLCKSQTISFLVLFVRKIREPAFEPGLVDDKMKELESEIRKRDDIFSRFEHLPECNGIVTLCSDMKR